MRLSLRSAIILASGLTLFWATGVLAETPDGMNRQAFQQLVETHAQQVNEYAALFDPISTDMREAGVPDWQTCLVEHLVRCSQIRAAEGQSQADSLLREAIVNRFVYVPYILRLLSVYDVNHATYPDFSRYFPSMVQSLGYAWPTNALPDFWRFNNHWMVLGPFPLEWDRRRYHRRWSARTGKAVFPRNRVYRLHNTVRDTGRRCRVETRRWTRTGQQTGLRAML